MHCPLRLQADPARVVVRPFHIPIDAGVVSGRPGRVRRIADAVLALDDEEAEVELELVLRDFEARHWQTRAVFLTPLRCDPRGAELEERRHLERQAPADRRLFLPRIQLCRRRADEPERGGASGPERPFRWRGAHRHVAARGGRGAHFVRVVPRGHSGPRPRGGADARAALRHRGGRRDRGWERRDQGPAPSRQLAIGNRAVSDDRRAEQGAGGHAPRPLRA